MNDEFLQVLLLLFLIRYRIILLEAQSDLLVNIENGPPSNSISLRHPSMASRYPPLTNPSST